MSDVQRYTVTDATGWMQPWPTSLPAVMVRASDYERLERERDTEERDCCIVMDERDRATAVIGDVHWILGGDGEWCGRLPPQDPPDSGDLHLDLPVLAEDVMRRLAAARAEAEALRHDMERQADTLAELATENEALRKDAARYRWLRDVVCNYSSQRCYVEVHEFCGPIAYGPSIDAAIDAAIAKEKP